jgi:hypothetical protein
MKRGKEIERERRREGERESKMERGREIRQGERGDLER